MGEASVISGVRSQDSGREMVCGLQIGLVGFSVSTPVSSYKTVGSAVVKFS